MTGSFWNWFEAMARPPWLLAAAVTVPGRSPEVKIFDAGFSREELEHALRSLTDAVDVAGLHRMPPRQMRWIYDRALVYSVKRSDGAVLNLFVDRQPPSAPAPGEIETMIDQFHTF